MCVGVPMLLTAIDGIAGQALDGDRAETVDLSLTPEARPGDWVLNFHGTAHAILPEDEALKIRAALQGLAAPTQGGTLGDAFADLDTPAPKPPPTSRQHLRPDRPQADPMHDHAPAQSFSGDLPPTSDIHPLIARLETEFHYPRLASAHDITEFLARSGQHCLFIPGDPRRNLETADAAVTFPSFASPSRTPSTAP